MTRQLMKQAKNNTTFNGKKRDGEKNTYSYDALHRLVGSSGAGSGNSYDMAMECSPSGRIREKCRDCQSATVSGLMSMVGTK